MKPARNCPNHGVMGLIDIDWDGIDVHIQQSLPKPASESILDARRTNDKADTRKTTCQLCIHGYRESQTSSSVVMNVLNRLSAASKRFMPSRMAAKL